MSKKLQKSEAFAPIFNRLIEICDNYDTSISKLLDDYTSSRSAISAWKNGNINSDVIVQIADRFNISTDYLLGRSNEQAFSIEHKKNSPSELTENEQKIIALFKQLSESQQGQLIGRAEMMAEYGVNQNNNYTSQIAAFGGDNAEAEISEENLKKALKALNKSDKKKTENK